MRTSPVAASLGHCGHEVLAAGGDLFQFAEVKGQRCSLFSFVVFHLGLREASLDCGQKDSKQRPFSKEMGLGLSRKR